MDATFVQQLAKQAADTTLGPFKADRGADVAGLDQLIGAAAFNRHEHPGHYLLNPWVRGPISELLMRLARRVEATEGAGGVGGTAATIANRTPYVNLASMPVSAIFGGAEKKHKLREMHEQGPVPSYAAEDVAEDATRVQHQHERLAKKAAELTMASRDKIPGSSFALPGRRYPVEDPAHARNALSRVSQFGSPAEKTKVRAAVHRRFPAIGSDKAAAAVKLAEALVGAFKCATYTLGPVLPQSERGTAKPSMYLKPPEDFPMGAAKPGTYVQPGVASAPALHWSGLAPVGVSKPGIYPNQVLAPSQAGVAKPSRYLKPPEDFPMVAAKPGTYVQPGVAPAPALHWSGPARPSQVTMPQGSEPAFNRFVDRFSQGR